MRPRLPRDPTTQLALLVAAWALTRFLVAVGTRVPQLYPSQEDAFDLTIFQIWGPAFAGDGGDVPLRDGPWEYPAGAALLIVAPALLRGAPYVLGFVGQTLLLDLAMLLLLALWGARRGSLGGAWFWVAAVPLLGPVVLGRFDLAPTLLAVAGVVAAAASAPLTAGVLLGTGAVVKLWPALLLPLVLTLQRGALRVVAGAVAVGLLTLVLVVRFADPSHLLSFLIYQRDRGLEIESVPALPLMLARLSGRDDIAVSFAFGSLQVDGPGAELLLRLGDLGLAAVLLLVAGLTWRARGTTAERGQAVLLLAVTLMTGLLLTDKVLSAQYPIWVAGLVALSLCWPSSPLRHVTVPLGGAMLLTQLVYPITFTDLIDGQALPVYLLAVRDLLLLVVFLQAGWAAWRLGGSEQRVAAGEHRSEQGHGADAEEQDGVVHAEALAQAHQRPHGREDDQVDARQGQQRTPGPHEEQREQHAGPHVDGVRRPGP